MDTKDVGQLGEGLACEYLVKKGFRILGRNYRITFGEIDIIARKNLAPLNKIFQILASARKQKLFNWVKGLAVDKLLNNLLISTDKTIHFVEVKSLANHAKDFFPEERVNYKKQEKLKRLSEIWLAKHKFPQNYPYQIDIIAVSIENNKKEIVFFGNIVSG